MKRHGTQFKKTKWNESDRQSYRDGDRLRASTMPSKRDEGPQASEWDYDDEDEGWGIA
jgi:hypothetical protein